MADIRVTSTDGFLSKIEAGEHVITADEPETAGGTGQGPTPYDLLAASLGSCTAMTLRFYARRESIPLTTIEVHVQHARKYAKDCAECLSTDGYIHHFEVTLHLAGDLTSGQREKLLEIAGRCPVHKTLTHEIRIDTRLADRPPAP